MLEAWNRRSERRLVERAARGGQSAQCLAMKAVVSRQNSAPPRGGSRNLYGSLNGLRAAVDKGDVAQARWSQFDKTAHEFARRRKSGRLRKTRLAGLASPVNGIPNLFGIEAERKRAVSRGEVQIPPALVVIQ